MRIRRVLWLAVLVLCYAAQSFAASYPAGLSLDLDRAFPSSAIPVGDPASVAAVFTTLETDDLFGFYYSEQFPEWLAVETESVTLNGASISYLYEEGDPGEPISEWVSHRWVIGDPDEGGQLLLEYGDVLIVEYSLVAAAPGVVRMEHDGWFGLLDDMPVFGSDYFSPEVVFSSDNVAVPASAAEGIILSHAFPNPFNPSTRLGFSLESERRVEIDIVDESGRRVRHLVAERFAAGQHSVVWDGLNDDGVALPSGVYFVSLRAGGIALLGDKLVLVK